MGHTKTPKLLINSASHNGGGGCMVQLVKSNYIKKLHDLNHNFYHLRSRHVIASQTICTTITQHTLNEGIQQCSMARQKKWSARTRPLSHFACQQNIVERLSLCNVFTSACCETLHIVTMLISEFFIMVNQPTLMSTQLFYKNRVVEVTLNRVMLGFWKEIETRRKRSASFNCISKDGKHMKCYYYKV